MAEEATTAVIASPAKDKLTATKIPSLKRFPTPRERQEQSRQIIAYAVIAGYLTLLLLNISIPIILYWLSRPSDPQKVIPLTVNDIKDLTLAISSAISGLVGVLGFIMGYYFKLAEQNAKKEEAQ